MSKVMWIILSLSVSGSVIAGILFLLKPLLKDKISKAFLYYAWLIVLMRMVLPISAPVNAIDALVQKTPAIEETVIEERVETREAEQDAVFNRTEQESPVADTVYQSAQPTDQVDPADKTVIMAPNTAKTRDLRSVCKTAWNWLTDNLIVIWGAGALCVFLWFAVSYFRFSAKLDHFSSLPSEEDNAVFASLAGRSRVTMLYNSAVSTPLMIGVFNPRILVPEREYVKNGQKKQLESLLKHELMHYRRRDILYKWAAVIVSSLHWFNPLMPLIRREIAQECEFSCDEAVIRNMTIEEKTVYGETLLSFAVRRELPKGIAAATFGERKGNMKKRLQNIVSYRKKSVWIMLLTIIFAVALTGCAVVTGVTAGKEAKSEPPAAESAETIKISAEDIVEQPKTEEPQEDVLITESEDPIKVIESYLAGIASGASWDEMQAFFPRTLLENHFDEQAYAKLTNDEKTAEEHVNFKEDLYLYATGRIAEVLSGIVDEQTETYEEAYNESIRKGIPKLRIMEITSLIHDNSVYMRNDFKCDDYAEYAVLFSCGEKLYMQGFSMICYDGMWRLYTPGSGYVNANSYDPQEVTEEEYHYQMQKDSGEKGTSITVTEHYENGVTYFVGDIYIQDIEAFRTAFSRGEFNTAQSNRQFVWEQACDNDARIAITGDNCIWNNDGLVIRNGEVYRDTLSDSDICVLYQDGTMKTYSPEEAKSQLSEILAAQPWQGWSFGPMLLKDGQPMTEFNTKVAAENPRSAVGYYEPGHYCFVVVDGRQAGHSRGMTMQELSQLMYGLGCKEAYNLDGGNSAAMAVDGETISKPANGGRGVADILYIANAN